MLRKDVFIIHKITLTLAAFTLTAGLLSACNQETAVPATPPPAPANTPASSEQDSVAAEQTAATAPSTDEMDWNQIKDPLIDKAMKAKLKAAIDAIVAKDVDQFHEAIGQDLGTAHDYLLNNTMKFTHLDTAHEEGGRILVPAAGEMQLPGDQEVNESSYTFYFEKDQQGDWQIVSID